MPNDAITIIWTAIFLVLVVMDSSSLITDHCLVRHCGPHIMTFAWKCDQMVISLIGCLAYSSVYLLYVLMDVYVLLCFHVLGLYIYSI